MKEYITSIPLWCGVCIQTKSSRLSQKAFSVASACASFKRVSIMFEMSDFTFAKTSALWPPQGDMYRELPG